MSSDDRASAGTEHDPEEDGEEASRAGSGDPNESTAGLLDEDELLEHAHEVDEAIQEAKNRNG